MEAAPASARTRGSDCEAGSECDCHAVVEAIQYPTPERRLKTHAVLEGIQFGYLDEVLERRSSCALYRLIARIWDRVWNATIQSGNSSESRPMDEIFIWLDQSTSTPLTASGQRKYWTVGVDFIYVGRNGTDATKVPLAWDPQFALAVDDFDLLEQIPTEEVDDALLLGTLRSTDSGFDAEFIRQSFHTCINDHGETCSNPIRKAYGGKTFQLMQPGRLDLPTTMRFIDLENDCVGTAPSLSEYAVLSYVWGSSNFLTLSKANKAELESTGGFSKVQKPKTIDHAIQVVRSLGLRWLWIDSLCIIQDDPFDQTRLIAHMDTVYTKAVITIVAAESLEADDGIWSSTSTETEQQIVEKCSGLRFIALEPPLLNVIEMSQWNRRAWTYQEYVLSRRLLVFSKHQSYFICDKAAFLQDLIQCRSPNGIINRQFDADDETPGLPNFSLLQFPVFWRILVSIFTKRTMTYESDVLRSSSGVMAAHCRGVRKGNPNHQNSERVLCGLPVSVLFEFSLLWFHTSSSERRSVNRRGRPFPSWSWAGWVGEVSHEDIEDDVEESNVRIITDWAIEDVVSQEVVFRSKWLSQLTSRRSNATEYWSETNVNAETARATLSRLEDGILCFETRSLHLNIEFNFFQQLIYSNDQHCEHTGIYKLLRDDVWVGGVHLTHDIANELRSMPTNKHEVIALSIATKPWYLPYRSDPHSIDLVDEYVEAKDITLWGLPISSFDPENEAYNVMLIVWEGELAYRAGIGQVSKELFEKLRPVTKNIRLG